MARPAPSVLLVSYVEDERDLYGRALRAAGFAVTTCDDPACALDAARAVRPDVIITRIIQPRWSIDGIELVRRFKRDHGTRAALIITARIEPDYRVAAVEAGCDAYLLLPCLPDHLVAEVRRTLARAIHDVTIECTLLDTGNTSQVMRSASASDRTKRRGKKRR